MSSVAELTVLEFYSLVLTATIMGHFSVWCLKHFQTLQTNGERFIMAGGMFALFGLPMYIFNRVLF